MAQCNCGVDEGYQEYLDLKAAERALIITEADTAATSGDFIGVPVFRTATPEEKEVRKRASEERITERIRSLYPAG